MIKIMAGAGREIPFKASIFPGGEVHIGLDIMRLSSVGNSVSISALLKNSDDIFRLLLITDALKREGVNEIQLDLHYLPYARQDRVCNAGEALSIKVMCDLINAQNYKRVYVSDVHSDVAIALLDNAVHRTASSLLSGEALNNCILVAPDSGAFRRVSEMSSHFEIPFVRADKKRSIENWGVTVYSGHVIDKDFLIVDDICDGGRTFVELARKLKPLTCGAVNLYVTHGIFSKGMIPFSGLIDKVYCAYPWVFTDIFERDGFFNVKERFPL